MKSFLFAAIVLVGSGCTAQLSLITELSSTVLYNNRPKTIWVKNTLPGHTYVMVCEGLIISNLSSGVYSLSVKSSNIEPKIRVNVVKDGNVIHMEEFQLTVVSAPIP